MNRSRHLAHLSVAVTAAGLLMALILPAVASGATRPLSFQPTIGFDCVQGTASDNATIALTWKSAAGSVKAITHVLRSQLLPRRQAA